MRPETHFASLYSPIQLGEETRTGSKLQTVTANSFGPQLVRQSWDALTAHDSVTGGEGGGGR